MPASVSIASHAPRVEPSEPGIRSRQRKGGEKPGRSSKITSTLVIFTLGLSLSRRKRYQKDMFEILYEIVFAPLVFPQLVRSATRSWRQTQKGGYLEEEVLTNCNRWCVCNCRYNSDGNAGASSKAFNHNLGRCTASTGSKVVRTNYEEDC